MVLIVALKYQNNNPIKQPLQSFITPKVQLARILKACTKVAFIVQQLTGPEPQLPGIWSLGRRAFRWRFLYRREVLSSKRR